MNWMRNKLWRRQEGVALLMVLGFMAVSVPIITGYLAFTSALINDSEAKTRILAKQYASQGCSQYAAWKLNNDPAYAATFVDNPEQELNEYPGCSITIVAEPPIENSEEAYADLVLVLDVSGSINSSEFPQMQAAANAIVDAFNLETTAPRVRIGLVRFRGSSELVLGMIDVDIPGTSEPLNDAIDDLEQGGPGLSSGTSQVAALEGGAAAFSSGLGDRVAPPFQVQNLMIVMTDGDDSKGNSDATIAAASLATNATVFAIGVGDSGDISQSTIDAIATDPDAEHSFSVRWPNSPPSIPGGSPAWSWWTRWESR
jgi:hypothetical protein